MTLFLNESVFYYNIRGQRVRLGEFDFKESLQNIFSVMLQVSKGKFSVDNKQCSLLYLQPLAPPTNLSLNKTVQVDVSDPDQVPGHRTSRGPNGVHAPQRFDLLMRMLFQKLDVL